MRLHLYTRATERTVDSLKTKYVNKFKQYIARKDTKTQMMEMHGIVPFDQGLYHNQAYEKLMKEQRELRAYYNKEKSLKVRKKIADSQHQLWTEYIDERFSELPEEMEFSENFIDNLRQVFETFKDRRTDTVPSESLPEMHFEYASLFKFNLVLDPQYIEQMIHPNKGYLTYTKGGFQFKDLMEIYKVLLVATFEKLVGQDLLAQEISSFAYWNHLRKENTRGYLEFEAFTDLLKTVRFDIDNWEQFEDEFKYLLSYNEGEFLDTNEKVVRSDFFRQIFLERNL